MTVENSCSLLGLLRCTSFLLPLALVAANCKNTSTHKQKHAQVDHGQRILFSTASLTNGRQGRLHCTIIDGRGLGLRQNVARFEIRSECFLNKVRNDNWSRLQRQDGQGEPMYPADYKNYRFNDLTCEFFRIDECGVFFYKKIEGAPMRLQLWDTAGQERFRSLTSNFFGRADGFVLTYDISNRPSFDHVIGWMRDIKTRAPPDCDIVLCGNKCDLDNDRVVTYDEGKQLADEYGVQFFESSALTGQNVEKMFTALATTIKHKRIDDFEGAALQGAPSTDGASTTTDNRTIHLAPAEGGGSAKSPGCCQ